MLPTLRIHPIPEKRIEHRTLTSIEEDWYHLPEKNEMTIHSHNTQFFIEGQQSDMLSSQLTKKRRE